MTRDPSTFSVEEKIAAVSKASEKGHSIMQVARELDVDIELVSHWKKIYLDGPTKEQEARLLTQRVSKLEEKVRFLKNAFKSFSVESKKKYDIIEKHSSGLGVAKSCNLLGVAPHYYYERHKHKPSATKKQVPPELAQKATEIFLASNRTYGPDKMAIMLTRAGFPICMSQAYRLMREIGLVSVYSARSAALRPSVRNRRAVSNLFPNGATADDVNQVYISEVACILTGTGRLYVCWIIDACSRRLVGNAIGEKFNSELAIAALNDVLQTRLPALGFKVHVSQSPQFTSIAYKRAVSEAGGILSTSPVFQRACGTSKDSFYACLKTHMCTQQFSCRDQARNAFIEFVEHYNHEQPHPALGGIPPANYESTTTD